MVALGSFNSRVGTSSPRRAKLSNGISTTSGKKTIYGAGGQGYGSRVSSVQRKGEVNKFGQIEPMKKRGLGLWDAFSGRDKERRESTLGKQNSIKWGSYKSKQARKNVEIQIGGVKEGRIKTTKRGSKTIIKISDRTKVNNRFLDKVISSTSGQLGEKSRKDLSSSKKKKFKNAMREAIDNPSKKGVITGRDLF